ncbi:hypothetical protein KI387_001174, partial [Taxus chinensis]
IVRRGLLEYFWFDVRCQARRIRAELERGYDADDEREIECPQERRRLTARAYRAHLRDRFL